MTKDAIIATIEGEVEGIETGLEVLVDNVTNHAELSKYSERCIESMEKRMEHIKEMCEKLK